ncbi:acetyl-CoA carboxylase biotin carboxylase subunit family protein, partial [Streptomyces sp. WAC06614]|uniref:ATP-grasp domain-containing protein n=1 Tax=Streptomyces sp. WAC06614 TaxID=2487416 RepID=UPI000F77774C
MVMHHAHGPVVLIGAKPVDGFRTLARMGIPFLCVADPEEKPPATVPGAIDVVHAPFRADPLCVLGIPLPPAVRAVLSFTELGSLPAALLSEALGLPTVPVRAVVRARNKLLMRRTLAGVLEQPAFGVVGRDDPGPGDFPVVAKPVDGSGSRNVEHVPDADTYAGRRTALAGFLWEAYVTGAEYSVEAVSFDGRHEILGITAKRTNGRPYFIETGHEVPARLTPQEERAAHACVRRCLDALEITHGASHTEVILTGGRAVLLETHTRGGGDRIPFLTRLVTGVDQYELAVRSVLPETGEG